MKFWESGVSEPVALAPCAQRSAAFSTFRFAVRCLPSP